VQKAKVHFQIGSLLAAMALLAFVAFGCSNDAPLAPSQNGPGLSPALTYVLDQFGVDPLQGLTGNALAKKKECFIHSATDTVDVDENGAIVYLDLGEGVSEFEIPGDAVCKDYEKYLEELAKEDPDEEKLAEFEAENPFGCPVRITADAALFNTPHGPLVMYDFGPDGLEFNKECKLRLWTDFGKDKLVWLYWFDPEKGQWVKEDKAKKTDKEGAIEFKITHFSKYAIS
jgi:hypothetical protein